MKILLINNNTVHLPYLYDALAGHDIEIQRYAPGLDFHFCDKDLIILSGGGGEGLEINDADHHGKLWYEDEMKFVKDCQKPLIGICMGFEVIAKAYGQPVPELSRTAYGTTTVEATKKGQELFNKARFHQIEAHNWSVPEAPDNFEILAQSANGVEVMHDPAKRQIGTQFHPELGGSLKIDHLISALV